MSRTNGLEVHSVNNMKPQLTSPITPSTRLAKVSGSWRLNAATAALQIDRIKIHSNSEPSCAPHTAATRYNSGSCELELRATYSTEKSLFTNAYTRQAKAITTNTNCPATAGRATLIQSDLPRHAPPKPKNACARLSTKAKVRANTPSSGVIACPLA